MTRPFVLHDWLFQPGWAEWNLRDDARQGAITLDARARWALWYALDKAELTEHGTMVPGWLTNRGREVLAALDADQYEDDGERAYHALHDR